MAPYETVLTELPALAEALAGAGRAMLMFGDVPFEAPGTAYRTLKRASPIKRADGSARRSARTGPRTGPHA